MSVGQHIGPWKRIAGLLRRGERACRIAITGVEGSSPREIDAAMLVTSDGGFTGTIGGGALEWQALAFAQKLLAENPGGKGISRAFSLGPDLGQCCGGRVTLLFEALAPADLAWITVLAEAEAHTDYKAAGFETTGTRDSRGIFLRAILASPRPAAPRLAGTFEPADPHILHEHHGTNRIPLLLFGAGHVGRALILAMAPLPFHVRWVDARPEAFPGHHPVNVIPVFTPHPVSEIVVASPGTLLLAMTHSHALDLDLVAAGLANPAISFVGVIGSATKRARFVSRLRALGLAEETVSRMVCPIGMPGLAGKEPAVIAAGVAVQMLDMRERHLQLLKPTLQRTGRATLPA